MVNINFNTKSISKIDNFVLELDLYCTYKNDFYKIK